MYIFYIDESGKASDPYLSHIIYSGFAIHDTSYGYIVNSLDKLVRQHFDCELKNIPEIHASLIWAGSKEWRKYSKEKRRVFLKDIIQLVPTIRNSYIIATATNKNSNFHKTKGLHATFEDIVTRFSRALHVNKHSITGAKQKASGIIIVDKNNSQEDEYLRTVSSNLREGNIRYYAPGHFLIQEDSLFVNSHNSLMMQIADCISWGVHRFYNKDDDTYINILANTFHKDATSGIVHGLTHKRDRNDHCECIACHRK